LISFNTDLLFAPLLLPPLTPRPPPLPKTPTTEEEEEEEEEGFDRLEKDATAKAALSRPTKILPLEE